MSDVLRTLATAHGVAIEFRDIWGALHRVSDATLRAILAAMRVDAADDARCAVALEDIARARRRQLLAPLIVVDVDARPWRLCAYLPKTPSLEWRLVCEDGSAHAGGFARIAAAPDDVDAAGALELTLDVELAAGYHELTLLARGHTVATTTLAVAPAACYRPLALRGGRRWGVALQLYGIRSARNWGIGDFSDLADVAGQCAAAGADIVGVNPLHALRLHPLQPSPYSPSSRLFLDALYVDVEAVPEFAACAEVSGAVGAPAFAALLERLRGSRYVDYAGVAAAKLDMLARLHAFSRRNGDRSRAAGFARFCEEGGEPLRRHALFEALQEHFHRSDPAIWGWPAWPEPYRDPSLPAVGEFERDHAERIDFHRWLQWQVALQRADAAAHARAAGLAIGLYADLAVSIDRGGSEAWAAQDLYAATASVGAPPDDFNAKGQDWGLPPMIPRRLVESGYAPFIATLRACMRDAGALRIDHVMGLRRLYWVPAGASAAEGAYVDYPLADLVGLLALESHRHRCVVIGEDLGTVPDDVRESLAAADVLSYRVLLFERDASGEFTPPSDYPEAALAVASTHDLPTLAGWWEGRDIRLRGEHRLLPAGADEAALLAARVHDRGRLLAALQRAQLLPAGTPLDPRVTPTLTADLATAIQRYLGRTRAALAVVQIEDVLGVHDQTNLPGTVDEHPNWRRKLSVPVDDVSGFGERLRALGTQLAHERGRSLE